MRAETPFGQREFFLKSSRPSFLIKRAALGNLKASFHCIHWHRFFPLKKASFENLPSMVFTPPSVPPLAGDRNLRREEETAPCWRARYRCALRLAGHQSYAPCLCGMGPPCYVMGILRF